MTLHFWPVEIILKNQMIHILKFPRILLVFPCFFDTPFCQLDYCYSCLDLSASWTLVTVFFPVLGKFSTIILQIFSGSFFLLLLRHWYCVTLSQMSLNLSAFHSFHFVLQEWFSPPLSSSSQIHPFTSLILLIPSRYIYFFLISLLFICGVLYIF